LVFPFLFFANSKIGPNAGLFSNSFFFFYSFFPHFLSQTVEEPVFFEWKNGVHRFFAAAIRPEKEKKNRKMFAIRPCPW